MNAEGKKSKKSSKPVYLRDYEREQLLRKGRLDWTIKVIIAFDKFQILSES